VQKIEWLMKKMFCLLKTNPYVVNDFGIKIFVRDCVLSLVDSTIRSELVRANFLSLLAMRSQKFVLIS
jgi:hypothetical protein